MGRTWSKRGRFSSSGLSVYACLYIRVIITEEDLAHFCLSWSNLIEVEASENSSLSMATT